MAFSGNDLVNFVGVPIAAWNSYQAWEVSGVAADAFSMGILAKKVPSNVYLLLIAGAIMVLHYGHLAKHKMLLKQVSIYLDKEKDMRNLNQTHYLELL